MAVQPKDFIEQLYAEAVQHRQHDDERGDAEHYPDHRKYGDNRHRALLAGTQIAEGEQPLERCKNPSTALCRRMLHSLPRDLVLPFGFGAVEPDGSSRSSAALAALVSLPRP